MKMKDRRKSLEVCDNWGNLTLPLLSLSPGLRGDYEYYNNEPSRKRSALLIIFTPTNKEIVSQITLALEVSSLGGLHLFRILEEAVNGFKSGNN